MAYNRTQWVNEETQLNARNMNNIEDGIEESLDKMENVTKNEISLLAGKTANNFRTITAGTTDLEEGVSALATDAIYLVYELDE